MIEIITEEQARLFYSALLEKDPAYEGLFFVGLKKIGTFCKSTCSKRNPKFEDCTFYKCIKGALFASLKPCPHCSPLSDMHGSAELIKPFIDAVEANPERRWKEEDFRELSTNIEAAQYHFQKNFRITLVEYAGARRMAIAFREIKEGKPSLHTAPNTEHTVQNPARDAFSKIMSDPPKGTTMWPTILKAAWIETLLGPMCAISDDKELYLLEFVDRRGLEREVERLRIKTKAAIIPGSAPPITRIKEELTSYFAGHLKKFKTPIHMIGSPFQKKVWRELREIEYSHTRSYLAQAKAIGHDHAFRAVANANGANKLAIIVPCHRIINSHGALGGYGGGVARKRWLITHEKQHQNLY